MRSTTNLLLAFTLALAACGGNSDNNNNNVVADPPDMATLPPDLSPPPRGPYPDGPYGLVEGSVLFNLTAKGYHLKADATDATSLQYEDVSIGELHANPACKCIMLAQSATWCGPCNAEQATLVQAETDDPSLCVFNVLVDGPTPGKRPTPNDVLDWNGAHSQNFPIVGSNIQTYLHLPSPTALPTNVVIDPVTMKIISIGAGFDPNAQLTAKNLCNL